MQNIEPIFFHKYVALLSGPSSCGLPVNAFAAFQKLIVVGLLLIGWAVGVYKAADAVQRGAVSAIVAGLQQGE